MAGGVVNVQWWAGIISKRNIYITMLPMHVKQIKAEGYDEFDHSLSSTTTAHSNRRLAAGAMH